MKKNKKCMFCFLIIISVPVWLFSDYILVCPFFGSTTAKTFKVSEEGDITFWYNFQIDGYPTSLTFSPDGHWGLIGSPRSYYPEKDRTIVLGIDKVQNVSMLESIWCDKDNIVLFTNDSMHGFFGSNLRTINFNSQNQHYQINTTENPALCSEAGFSIYSNKIIAVADKNIKEFDLNSDEIVYSTGFLVDISPSTGNAGIDITPDGKTCIITSYYNYQITTLNIKQTGGFDKVQQFNPIPQNAWQCEITYDSKYAIVLFTNCVKSFLIGNDAQLTEVGHADIKEGRENLAVTPDGKYAITRYLYNDKSVFQVVKINAGGTLQYLPEKDLTITGHISAMAFLPPYQEYLSTSWYLY